MAIEQSTTLAQILPIASYQVGAETLATVNGRDLHAWLGVQKHFSDWAKAQIKRAKLFEHMDFEVFPLTGGNSFGGRPRIEYILSQDAAEKIAAFSLPRILKNKSSSYIYMIRHGKSSYYKIGKTYDVDCRLKELQTGNPKKLTVARLWAVEDSTKIERFLHMSFAENRVEGEWFRLGKLKQQELFELLLPYERII